MEITLIDLILQKRRSLEQALDDLRMRRAQQADPTLDRMITQLEAELAARQENPETLQSRPVRI